MASEIYHRNVIQPSEFVNEQHYCPQSVQSELFHSRKQQVQEKVDEYAQDLSRLYQKAYPQALQGTGETEIMGKTVLAYQFVAGLLPKIRAKVAGTEGTFEQPWIKARYEEAKARDLEPTSTVGYPTNRRPPVVREDGRMLPQTNPIRMSHHVGVGCAGRRGILRRHVHNRGEANRWKHQRGNCRIIGTLLVVLQGR